MKRGDVFWGLLLIVAGILIIASKLGFYSGISVFGLVMTVILVGILVKSIIRVDFAGMLFPIAFLCIIYAKAWHLTAITPWPVLAAALLGSIGLSMIFKKSHLCNHKWHEEHFSEVINQPDGNVVNCQASFASSMKYINTEQFEQANIRSSFGAMKIYFDNAAIPSGQAEINLDISFSGVELYIPKNWKIINNVSVSAGGVEEKNRSSNSDSPVVTLRGSVSFGGVDIIYV